MAGPTLQLGRRERQIVETVYRLGEASVAEVRTALPDPPTYSAVRAMLNLLVQKKVVTYRQEGKRYLYRPVAAKNVVRRSALKNLVRNFFSGEPAEAVAALLDGSAGRVSPADIEKIKRLVDEAEAES
jgi:BlaI family transcriptional regulator, penicillinase repressor